jgi:hypothetical protein
MSRRKKHTDQGFVDDTFKMFIALFLMALIGKVLFRDAT